MTNLPIPTLVLPFDPDMETFEDLDTGNLYRVLNYGFSFPEYKVVVTYRSVVVDEDGNEEETGPTFAAPLHEVLDRFQALSGDPLEQDEPPPPSSPPNDRPSCVIPINGPRKGRTETVK